MCLVSLSTSSKINSWGFFTTSDLGFISLPIFLKASSGVNPGSLFMALTRLSDWSPVSLFSFIKVATSINFSS